MEEVFRNPVQFAKGVNLRDLLSSGAEFHIDLDFKQGHDGLDVTSEHNIIDGDDESETEDVYSHIEQRTEEAMLSSPEYHSFEELQKKMLECHCIPSGAVRLLIMEEDDGPLVPTDAEVTIHYAAYWEKGKIPFDSTLTMNNGVPLRMRLGQGRCLPGLEIALTNIKGPTARFLALLKPEVAWGEHGVPPRIKPEPALFVVALYAVHEWGIASRFNELPSDEQSKFETTVRTVHALRNTAKELFKRKRYNRAMKDYQQAMSVLSISHPKNDAQKNKLKDLKIKIYVNLAVCYYKLNKPKYILNMCDNIDLLIDINTHCKALFYNGRAYQMLGKTDKALDCYKKALKLEPRNEEIGAVLLGIDSESKKNTETEQEMWQKAFESEPKEKKEMFNVDEDFQNGVREMCQDLAGRSEYSKFDLPNGLSADEVLCIKSLVGQFKGLVVSEDGTGKKKKVTIIKKLLP